MATKRLQTSIKSFFPSKYLWIYNEPFSLLRSIDVVSALRQRKGAKTRPNALDDIDIQTDRQLAVGCLLPRPTFGMTYQPTNLGFCIRLGKLFG
jgi:hypothetical protein